MISCSDSRSSAISADRGSSTYSELPAADINVFGLDSELDLADARWVAEQTDSLCLFTRDSGKESALD